MPISRAVSSTLEFRLRLVARLGALSNAAAWAASIDHAHELCALASAVAPAPARTASPPAAHTGRRAPPARHGVPVSTMRPASSTTMRSARCTVARRCAMTSVVRPAHRRLRARPAPCARSRRRARWWLRPAAAAAGSSASRARCDALALAARQAHAALAEVGVVALGQGADEVVREGGLGGGDHLVVAGARAGRSGCSPARWSRRSRCPAARCRCAGAASASASVAHRHAVDRHAALLRVVEAQQQLQHGALAGAAGADQRHRLAGLHVEVEVAQRGVLRARRVVEAHVRAAAPTSRRCAGRQRARLRRARPPASARPAVPSGARWRRPRAAGRRRPRTAPPRSPTRMIT